MVMSSEPTGDSAPTGGAKGGNDGALEREKAYLSELGARPWPARIKGYIGLSGPGWLQSALTLGGGSLASSLYLGVLAGSSLLWLQPLAMVLGIIMLSAIGYVTLSTGEPAFRAINKHVNPVLGWGWLLASLAANMVWALPQYALATGVLQQNLAPGLLGAGSGMTDLTCKLLIAAGILLVTTAITWSYGSGHWGVVLYERILKVVVAVIVLCFVGVVVRLTFAENGIEWGGVLAGFVPDFGNIFSPAERFDSLLGAITDPQHRQYWSNFIVARQEDVLISAFATAVGINMTFLLPYSMLGRGWGREHRGLATFDLSTGMFIPFVLATSCVVIASAHQFHGVPQKNLVRQETAPESMSDAEAKQLKGQMGAYYGLLAKRAGVASEKGLSVDQTRERIAELDVTDAERSLAATLVRRDAFALADSLTPLTGPFFANLIFGIGVLGMTLSTITLLMLISGFITCEVLGVPSTGWTFRIGSLLAATGALGPFLWSGKVQFWLAVPTSVFGACLLPVAYITFLLLINQRSLLKDQMPSGMARLLSNGVMFVAASVATVTSLYTVWSKVHWYGVAGIAAFLVAVAVAHFARSAKRAA